MRRSKAILGALALATAAGLLYRRLGFRPREWAELQFDDASTVRLSGSPDVDELKARAQEALAVARAS